MPDLTSPPHESFHTTTVLHRFQHEPERRVKDEQRLRLLSFNIQVGISSSRYRHYLIHSWKHLLPHNKRLENLDRIATLISDFDIVALQEVDSGSFRSSYINQIEYLAVRGHFPFWKNQINRNLGRIAQHSNGLLSRYRPQAIIEHKLPGILPGRGIMEVRYGPDYDPLVLFLLHLGLGKRGRMRQMDFISNLVNQHRHVVIMGDFNCAAHSDEMKAFIDNTHLCRPIDDLHTYPSWQPIRNIDHFMVSPSIGIHEVQVIGEPLSDHLPIMVEISVPKHIAKYWRE